MTGISGISQADVTPAVLGESAAAATQTPVTETSFSKLLQSQLDAQLLSIAAMPDEEEDSERGPVSSMQDLTLAGMLLTKQLEDVLANSQTQAVQSTDSEETSIDATSETRPASSVSDRTSPLTASDRENVAERALTRVGDPYSQPLRGQGSYVDCSYLTKWAYKGAGLSIPGTAAEQARWAVNTGIEIPTSELQKGDLVFWQKKGCTCGRYDEIHHVGIYLGDGKIVEASSSSGKVVVNNMWGEEGLGKWQIAMCARPV